MLPDPALKRLEGRLQDIFHDRVKLRRFLELEGYEAQSWLDSMQQLVDCPYTAPSLRASIYRNMLRLSERSGLHPQCLAIQNVKKLGEFPIAAGGFGDVWQGIIGESTEFVCLKVVKIYLHSDMKRLSNEYMREAILWRQMKHPNLLPFLGIYQFECHQQLCLISPWMDNGNLVQYLRTTRREDVDHYTLVHDIASGLAHLHVMKIVHSDLKGVNILITDSFRACIGDFGLSRIADTQGLSMTTSSRPRGTGRWLAPELLFGGLATKQSDIYAFGCVCFEIFTSGQHPFPELTNEAAVALAVTGGRRPARPVEAFELIDAMWTLMVESWLLDPLLRPNAHQSLDRLSKMDFRKTTSSPPDWGESVFTQVWGNVEYRSVVGPALQINGTDSIKSSSTVNLRSEVQIPEPRPWSGRLDDSTTATAGSVSSSPIQQDKRPVSIGVTTGAKSTGFSDNALSSPTSHKLSSSPSSPAASHLTGKSGEAPSPQAHLGFSTEKEKHCTVVAGVSVSNPIAPSVTKIPREDEASKEFNNWSVPPLRPFRTLVSENQVKHTKLVRAIAQVRHAPGALSAQQRKIKDLQLKVEESMLSLVEISEKLIRQSQLLEATDNPRFGKPFSVMPGSFSRVAESPKPGETDVTYLRKSEETTERDKHNQLREALSKAAVEERALEEQARIFVLMTNELDTLYDDLFNESTPDFPEEKQLQQQVATAKATCDRIGAEFDAETQAYERLYHAEKALHECLANLKNAVRYVGSSIELTSGRSVHELRVATCLQIAHTLASQVPSLVQEARQLSPTVKPLRALVISQSVPDRMASESRERYSALLEDIISETTRAYAQERRTAGTQSVLEGAAQTLQSNKEALRATRKRIFDEVARGISDEAAAPAAWVIDEEPPPYTSTSVSEHGHYDHGRHDGLSQVAISNDEQVIGADDSQLSISNKKSRQETPGPGPSFPVISHPVARPKPYKKWKFWSRAPGPADGQLEIVQYRLQSCDAKSTVQSTVSRAEKQPLPAPSGLRNLQAW
ncbi:hypothetical protein PQX77_003955 [Marasmius sp. AFHP31]|nr:hypothetical protein PQX77_003955 [Marasmius sp. AFHP31]